MENKVESKEEVKAPAKAKSKKEAAPKAAAKPAAPPPPMTAAQKLEALENSFMVQSQQIDILAEEIDNLRKTIVNLNKRLNASIKAAEEGGLTGESVNKIILNEGMRELEERVSFLISQGVLVRNDAAEISDTNFVVGRELDTEGNVTNPRVQFSVVSIDKEVKDQIHGKKAGDVIAYSETEDSMEITEVYDIVDPKIKKSFEPQQAAQ